MTWDIFGIILLAGYIGYVIGRLHTTALSSQDRGTAT